MRLPAWLPQGLFDAVSYAFTGGAARMPAWDSTCGICGDKGCPDCEEEAWEPIPPPATLDDVVAGLRRIERLLDDK